MSFRLRVIPVALAAAILLPVAASAQSVYPTTFGFKVGVNSSTLSISDDSDDVSSTWGAVGGAFVGRNISDNLGWQLEALFSQKGAEDAASSSSKIRLTYLDLPLTARFGSTTSNDVHFHFFTGPQLGLRLKAELKDDDDSLDIKDDIKSWDLGWTLGAGVERGALSLDARYTLGLTNISKFDSDGDVKNRAFTVLLGYRLK